MFIESFKTALRGVRINVRLGTNGYYYLTRRGPQGEVTLGWQSKVLDETRAEAVARAAKTTT